MRTPAGTECPYFYGDYFRGRNLEECRLLKSAGEGWTRDLVQDLPRAGHCPRQLLRIYETLCHGRQTR